jgi:hypothetical protein
VPYHCEAGRCLRYDQFVQLLEREAVVAMALDSARIADPGFAITQQGV